MGFFWDPKSHIPNSGIFSSWMPKSQKKSQDFSFALLFWAKSQKSRDMGSQKNSLPKPPLARIIILQVSSLNPGVLTLVSANPTIILMPQPLLTLPASPTRRPTGRATRRQSAFRAKLNPNRARTGARMAANGPRITFNPLLDLALPQLDQLRS